MLQEQLAIQTQYPIIARKFDYKHFTYPWHFHDEYEIIFVRESVGDWFVADNRGKYGPGDLFVLGRSVPHYLRSAPEYYEKETEGRVRGSIIQFEPHFMAHAIDNYAELQPVKDLLQRSKQGLLFKCDATQEWREIVESIPDMRPIDRIPAVLRLLVVISQNSDSEQIVDHSFTPILSPLRGSRMTKVRSYLLHHYTEPIDLNQIASLAAMNSSAFCRYFKEKSGKTLTEYVSALRIGFAKRLLIANDESIASVAMTCGFNSLSHFNRTFKLQVGLTPSEYSKKFT